MISHTLFFSAFGRMGRIGDELGGCFSKGVRGEMIIYQVVVSGIGRIGRIGRIICVCIHARARAQVWRQAVSKILLVTGLKVPPYPPYPPKKTVN